MEYDDKNQEPENRPVPAPQPDPNEENHEQLQPRTPYPYGQIPNGGQPGPTPPPSNTMAVVSMIAGIFALVMCCVPPMQLLLGAAAILLAILSKKGRPFSGFAVAGLILGGLSVICSIAVFAYFMLVMKMMQDPQYAPMFQDVMKQYQDLINGAPVQ